MKYDELNIDRVRNEFSLLAEELSLLYPDETFEVFVVGTEIRILKISQIGMLLKV